MDQLRKHPPPDRDSTHKVVIPALLSRPVFTHIEVLAY